MRREPVVRFETPPGLQAQVDFADLARHQVAGVATDIYLFVMVLGFLQGLCVEAITDCRSETFLYCHVNAFAAFGDMPREILYDNAKVVALEHSRTVVTFNAALLGCAGRYGFRRRLCRPYRANRRTHATTGERPVDRLAREGLIPLSSAMPWRPALPAPRPGRAIFRFEELPLVETRPLSVYEEVCT